MKELFTGSDSNEVKARRLKMYMESGKFLEMLFSPQEFLEPLVLFATQVLNSTEPEKKSSFMSGGNEMRYTVLRFLNKFSLKSVRSVELVYALHNVLQNDNLPNVILSLKALGSLSGSGVISGDLVDVHVGALLGMVHDLFANMENGDESLIEISLFTLTETLIHARAFFHNLECHAIKIDQFLACVYGHIRRIFENRRFMDGIVHKRVFSISMCSGICSLLKLTCDQLPAVSKSGPYHMFASEAAFAGMYCCPSELLGLRQEIYTQFSKVCVGSKDMALPIVDKTYVVPFLFSPDALPMNTEGIRMLNDMLGHVKESLSKAAYAEFGSRVSNVLFSSCSLIKRLSKEASECSGREFLKRKVEDVVEQHIEAIRVCLEAVENVCKCFGNRAGDVAELSDVYLRSFYDMKNGFEGIKGLAGLVFSDKEGEIKKIVERFISGFRELVGRIGILEKSGNTVIFSVSEVHILYRIFEDSFDVFSHEFLCQEQKIEEFFSVLTLIREHIAGDIIKCCSEKVLEYSKRNKEFFGVWKLINSSTVLGNALSMYVLPQIVSELSNGGFEFVKEAMKYIVPFFRNDIKKIKRVNTFFMHRIISTLMTANPKNIQHFEVLLEIFNIFGSMPEKSSFFQKYIFDNFARIVDHLMKLYETQGRDIFIEMIFALPISINLLESDIQFLIRPIEKALMLGGAIKIKALSILVYVLDFSTEEKIAGLERTWESILKSVVRDLEDNTISSLCSRILGKLKTYHKVFARDYEGFKETNENLQLIRLIIDGKHGVPAHLLFFDAVQKMRGTFELHGSDFESEGFLVRFRRLGPRSSTEDAKDAAFRLITSVIYHLMGWRFLRKDLVVKCYTELLDETEEIRSVSDALDCVYSVHGIISSLCGRKCTDSRRLAQYIYDGILALFSCHGTSFEKKAQELLHSIFGTVMLFRVFSFHGLKSRRYKILLDTDTFFDALIESFSDIENPMPFKVLSIMFTQMYELLGNKSEYFCIEMYGTVFSKFKSMCRSSDKRSRDCGINGMLCLAAVMPIRELVMLRVPEDSFSHTYLYLLPRGSEDFSLPLKLVIFILRFRYRGIRNYLLSEGTERYFMASHFKPFVAGLFDSRKDVSEFSKAVLREVFHHYGPQLSRHRDIVFGFFKKDYVIESRAMMILHLKTFVFCVEEGKCPFDDCEMKYIIEKLLDSISSNDEWRGAEGIHMNFNYRERNGRADKKKLCECNREEAEGDDGVGVVLGGIYKKLSELSVRDLMDIALKNAMDVLCGKCRKEIYRHTEASLPRFNNEAEELMYWIREFYLLVIKHRKSFEEIRTGVTYMLRYISDDTTDYLQMAYDAKPEETERVISEEVEKCLSEKVDYKVLNMLQCAHSIDRAPENPRIGMLVLKILKEFKVPKEFAIISQNDKYSMLAKAYEIGISLRNQEGLCNEILETYFTLDGYVKSYTSRIYPRMIKYVEGLGQQFISCMFRRIQDPSAYNLCSRLCNDSPKLKEIVSGMKDRLAERISQIYCRLEGNDSIDKSIFIYSYKFLDLAGHEMRPVDIQVILGIYGDMKGRPRYGVEMRELISKCINRFSPEDLEALFKMDPWFVSVNGIDARHLSGSLSPMALRGVVRSIDKGNVLSLERHSALLGENRHALVELFVDLGIRSENLIGYCKENLHNTNLRGLLLYYLCTFEPLYIYFEALFKLPYEDRKYTQYCLERVVDAFDPLLFEEIILIVLRSEVRFKTSLWILFPLLLSRPRLITKKIALELLGSIYKLLSSSEPFKQRMGLKLFEILHDKCPAGEDSPEGGCTGHGQMVRKAYTLVFVRFIHMDTDFPASSFQKYNLEVDFDLVKYSSKGLNLNNLFGFLEMEMASEKSEDYKRCFLRSVWTAVAPCFKSRTLGMETVRYLVDTGIWDYGSVPEELGTVAYDCGILYNLLCVLCGGVGKGNDEDGKEDENKMEICLCVVKYLLAEYSRNRNEMNLGYVNKGLENVFCVLCLSPGMKGAVDSAAKLFLEALEDSLTSIDLLVSKVGFLMSDFRTTLTDKISIACHLSRRGYDAEVLCEMLLPVFSSYRYSDAKFPDGLQKFLMKGLSSRNKSLRSGYLDLMNRIIPANKYLRLLYLLDLEWKHSTNIGYVIVSMMISSCYKTEIIADKYYGTKADIEVEYPWALQKMTSKGIVDKCNGLKLVTNLLEDIDLYGARVAKDDLLDILYYFDESLLPMLTGILKAVSSEFDECQCRSVFGSLVKFCSRVKGNGILGAVIDGLEPIYRYGDLSELMEVLKGGDGWGVLLRYASDRQKVKIYRRLMDSDGYFGMSRSVCSFPETMQACFLQQVGKIKEAQALYEEIQGKAREHKISFEENEYKAWQDEWIECAKELQQWDVCYEIGMEAGDHLLSGESLWHLSNFTLQETIEKFKNVVDAGRSGFEKEFYSTFASAFTKYSSEKIKDILSRNIEELRKYPAKSGARSRLLTYLQIIIEMVEAEPILNNRLDGAEALTSILFRWRDKEPSIYDSFEQWSLFRTWRRHVYSRVGMIEKMDGEEIMFKLPSRGSTEEASAQPSRRGPVGSNLFSPREVGEGSVRTRKELASKGASELAKVLNAFSKAAIDRGYYDAALFHLKEVFDLSSVKVGDAFQKVVYELLCFLGKKEYKIGVDQCVSANIQHFSDSQSSILFNLKGLFSEKLGKFSDAEKFYLQSAQVCNVVGENWLTWGSFLFDRADKEGGGPKEDAFVALLQAVAYCSGRKARRGILKMVLLMDRHSSLCDTEVFHKILREIDISRFIYFIPQLIGLLERGDSDLAQVILSKISEEYPQAVMGPLKAVKERMKRALYPKEDTGHKVRAHRTKAESRHSGIPMEKSDGQPLGVRSILLENIMRIYNRIRNTRLGKEFWKILRYLHNSFNSHAFKEEELVYLEIERIFNNAVSHVMDGIVPSGSAHAMLLNELISCMSLSSLSKGFKEELISLILGMRYICPLEKIDEMVCFKNKIQKVVEESFAKMDRFEESEVNLLLYRSGHEHKMFGQYSEIRSSYKNLVSIEMFEPRQSYMYRKKIGCNRIHLRGSDGRVYRYEMKGLSGMRFSEFAIPQLSLMINEAMKEEPNLCKRGAELRLATPFIVSEALAMKWTKEPEYCMDSILEEGLSKYGISIDQCVLLYLNHFASIYEIERDTTRCLENKYDLSRRLVRSQKFVVLEDECPNIRKGAKASKSEEPSENFINNAKTAIEKQRKKYVSNLEQRKVECLGCSEKGEGIVPCRYKYEVSRRQRYMAYEKMYNTFKMSSFLDDYLRPIYGNLGGYLGFKDRLLSSYSANTAFLYMLSIVDRRPRNIVITKSGGHFMNKDICYEDVEPMNRGDGGVIGPGYQKLFGKEGIEGAMLSIMYHYADMISKGDWCRDLIRIMLEGRFMDMAGEGFKGMHEKVLSKIEEMVRKGEDGTYNLIPMVSGWMDMFKMAQVDPRHMSWM
ncbi:focal adhesion kinase [Encephalitozoon hellem]|uniref:Focal adhesion kinase n=1 Tax=Encephalitozoon hellem TaxID=27973 RepID=A0ABY8CNR2_ENCHE|nr:focal adhesion kinase [Encephalitozoon hellem]